MSKKKKKRNNILIFLTLIFIISGISYTAYYKKFAQFYETTDNAYVKQNIVYVTPQISGVIDNVRVDVTNSIEKGELIAHIDEKDAKLAFEKAKNDLAWSIREVKKSYRQKDELENQIKLYKIKVQKAKDDFDRKKALFKNKAISQEKYDNSKYDYEEAKENLQITRKRLITLLATISDNKIVDNPLIKKAVVGLKQSYINLQRCSILAPVSGEIAKKNISISSSVSPASLLVAIVPNDGFWVDANFKETQLENIRIGQDVKLYSDVYGEKVEYHGKVEGISAGTGSVFSLLPAQNATGNWIKVVQRVPIRIKLNQDELKKYPLHVGNSMNVTVDTHKRDGKRIQNITKLSYSSNLYAKALDEANKIANEIIEKNL